MISFLFSFTILLNASNIDSVFLKLPSNLNPLLDAKNRFEMLEYFKAGQTDSVKNKPGCFAYILYRATHQKHINFRFVSNSII